MNTAAWVVVCGSGSAKGRSSSNSEGTAVAAGVVATSWNSDNGSGSTSGATSTSGSTVKGPVGNSCGGSGSGLAIISATRAATVNEGMGVNPWLGSSREFSKPGWLRVSREVAASESSGSALMRVMESESPMAGSIAAPKRTCAFSGTYFCRRCIKSSISKSVKSSPPDRWTSTVCASLSSAPWSSSGLFKAFFKAFAARSLPSARPEPKRQRERFVRRALIRSSSPTLIRPGRTTRRMTALIDSQIM